MTNVTSAHADILGSAACLLSGATNALSANTVNTTVTPVNSFLKETGKHNSDHSGITIMKKNEPPVNLYNSEGSLLILEEIQRNLYGQHNRTNSYGGLMNRSSGNTGIAAALMSSSLSNSSQFISPPLPGHLTDDHKRDRSNDADLKRDINVNSLISGCNSFLDKATGDITTALMATTNFYRQDPDSQLIMMMMPNADGLNRGFGGKKVSSEVLNKEKIQKIRIPNRLTFLRQLMVRFLF